MSERTEEPGPGLVVVSHIDQARTLFVRCGHGDRTRLLRDPHSVRFCREQALYQVAAADGYRNVCAEHLPLAVDLALGQDSQATT